jgi:hypothetical protein
LSTGEFINFSRLAMWNETFIYLVGWISFVSILQVLHLLRFNVRMTALGLVLKKASKELIYFSITFLIIFFAFCQYAMACEWQNWYSEEQVQGLKLCLNSFSFWSTNGSIPRLCHHFPKHGCTLAGPD